MKRVSAYNRLYMHTFAMSNWYSQADFWKKQLLIYQNSNSGLFAASTRTVRGWSGGYSLSSDLNP